MKRRSLFLVAALPLFLASCSKEANQDTITPSFKKAVKNPLQSLEESAISDNLSLTFGDETKDLDILSFVIDFGNSDSKDFLYTHIDDLKLKAAKEEPFEIVLVNFPKDESANESNNSSLNNSFYSPSYAFAALGIFAYVKDPVNFFNFVENLRSWENTQGTLSKRDLIVIAEGMELLPNLDLSGNNAISKTYVDEMTKSAMDITDTAPSILVNNELWKADFLDSHEVQRLIVNSTGEI